MTQCGISSGFSQFAKVPIKAAYSVTMNIFRKKNYFLFKSFVKVELSYVFTIKMFSTAENCMEKCIISTIGFFFSLVGNYLRPSNNSKPLNFNINAVVLIVIPC